MNTFRSRPPKKFVVSELSVVSERRRARVEFLSRNGGDIVVQQLYRSKHGIHFEVFWNGEEVDMFHVVCLHAPGFKLMKILLLCLCSNRSIFINLHYGKLPHSNGVAYIKKLTNASSTKRYKL